MSAGWGKPVGAFLIRLGDLALNLLIMGGIEVLVALAVWPLLFRAYPQGFSMALSLVGFSVWAIASFASLRSRRPSGSSRSSAGTQESPPRGGSIGDRLKQVQPGSSLLFFFSSLIPLALAFILRVLADLRAGYTWHDLFPPFP